MSKINDGGPAYPNAWTETNEYGVQFPYVTNGMSLRDHIASKALAGLCANPGGPFQRCDLSGWAIVNCTVGQVADEAYRLADAMLAARAKGGDADG